MLIQEIAKEKVLKAKEELEKEIAAAERGEKNWNEILHSMVWALVPVDAIPCTIWTISDLDINGQVPDDFTFEQKLYILNRLHRGLEKVAVLAGFEYMEKEIPKIVDEMVQEKCKIVAFDSSLSDGCWIAQNSRIVGSIELPRYPTNDLIISRLKDMGHLDKEMQYRVKNNFYGYVVEERENGKPILQLIADVSLD